MNKNLGAFTCYGIEYVFDYLTESKIRQRIKEVNEKPTGSMGPSLEHFAFGDPEYSYYGGKGPFWVFNLLLQWFNQKEFAEYLFRASQKYTEANYHDSGLLKSKWNYHVGLLDNLIESQPEEKAYYEASKLNPYWMELHFLYRQLSHHFITEELITNYIHNFEAISTRIKQEFSSNQKTLLSNGLILEICKYYEKSRNNLKARETLRLNNKYSDVWREIPEYDDEEQE